MTFKYNTIKEYERAQALQVARDKAVDEAIDQVVKIAFNARTTQKQSLPDKFWEPIGC